MTGNFPKRGSVYWVCLDLTIGSEPKKTRPCLVVSNDSANEASGIVIVAPITSKAKKIYSFEVAVVIVGKSGKVMLNQCRAIDKARLGKKECPLDFEAMEQVDEAVRVAFGIG